MKSPRHLVALVTSTAFILAISTCFTATVYGIPGGNIPSSIKIAVSYADTERSGACTDCFPNPWCGSPGVQFIGSSTNYNGKPNDTRNCAGGDWDTGAVLVTNTGETPITLSNLTIELPLPVSGNPGSPTCQAEKRPITFNIWFGQQYYYGNPADLAYSGGLITIPAGGQAIFAGTSSDGTYKCPSGNYPSGPTDGTYDFDTSDAYFLDGCTPTTDAASSPLITISTTQYAPTMYIDNGHTIDTGGIDTGNCKASQANPGWPNESLGWRLVSSTCGEDCPTNQFLGVATSAFSMGGTTTTSTALVSSSAAPTSTASGGVNATVEYGIAAVVLAVVVTGYLAMRRRSRPPKLD